MQLIEVIKNDNEEKRFKDACEKDKSVATLHNLLYVCLAIALYNWLGKIQTGEYKEEFFISVGLVQLIRNVPSWLVTCFAAVQWCGASLTFIQYLIFVFLLTIEYVCTFTLIITLYTWYTLGWAFTDLPFALIAMIAGVSLTSQYAHTYLIPRFVLDK